MDRFGDLDVFAHVVTARSMSAAARELNLSPAVISKRIRRLEDRLGVRLLQRTTRQLSLTEAGQGFYERVVSILGSIEEAEAWVASGAGQARGTLRVSAPTSFGRMHVAPHLKPFLDANPAVNVELILSDAFVDIIAEGFDLAVRIADLRDPSLVAKRLAPNHRVLCATPGYLAANGTPETIEDLSRHTLVAHNADQWRLDGPEGQVSVRINGPLRTNSSEVVREALLAGVGIALRSTWDVGPEVHLYGDTRRDQLDSNWVTHAPAVVDGDFFQPSEGWADRYWRGDTYPECEPIWEMLTDAEWLSSTRISS